MDAHAAAGASAQTTMEVRMPKLFSKRKPAAEAGDEKAARRGGAGWKRNAEASSSRVVDVERMLPNGLMMLPGGRWSVALAFDDVNYQSLRRQEQEDILDKYAEFLNSLDERVSTQVWISSTRIAPRDLSTRYALRPVEGDEHGNALRREVNGLLESKLSSSDRSMHKERALVFTCRAASREKAEKILAGACARAHVLFSSLESREEVLEWAARANMVNRMCNQDMAYDATRPEDLKASPGLSLADVVAPACIERLPGNPSDLLVGSRYVRSYIVMKYGSVVKDDLLSSLTQLSCDSVVSLHFTSWESEKARAFAESHLDDVRLEIGAYKSENTDPLRGRFVDDDNLPEHMKEALAEAIRVRDGLVSKDQRMFRTCLVVTVMGRDLAELQAGCDEAESVFGEQRINGRWISDWREKAFTASLPIGSMPLPFSRNFFTDPLSGLVPFTSVEVMDDGGVYMGTNFDTHNFILYSRERDEDANGFILGLPGAGKSFATKDLICQLLLRNSEDEVIVIDPEREYLQLAMSLQGQVVNIAEGSEDHINLFDISRFYGNDDAGSKMAASPLPLKVNFIQAAIHMMANIVTDEEMNVIDSVCSQIYQPYLDGETDEMPTLQTFYDALLAVRGAMSDDAMHLRTIISRYVEGTVNVFNNPTNVDLRRRFVVFDVRDLGSTLKPLALLIILDHIWTRVTANRQQGRRTWLFIDELQLLLEDDYALSFFDEIWTRSRKWGLFCTGITQNVRRLLEIRKTRYMVENTHFLMLGRQTPQAAQLLGEVLRLSESQQRMLRTATKGEGLYVFGRRVLHFSNVIPQETCPNLYSLLTTKFRDVAAAREATRAAAPEPESAAALDVPADPDGTYAMAPLPEAAVAAWSGAEASAARPMPAVREAAAARLRTDGSALLGAAPSAERGAAVAQPGPAPAQAAAGRAAPAGGEGGMWAVSHRAAPSPAEPARPAAQAQSRPAGTQPAQAAGPEPIWPAVPPVPEAYPYLDDLDEPEPVMSHGEPPRGDPREADASAAQGPAARESLEDTAARLMGFGDLKEFEAAMDSYAQGSASPQAPAAGPLEPAPVGAPPGAPDSTAPQEPRQAQRGEMGAQPEAAAPAVAQPVLADEPLHETQPILPATIMAATARPARPRAAEASHMPTIPVTLPVAAPDTSSELRAAHPGACPPAAPSAQGAASAPKRQEPAAIPQPDARAARIDEMERELLLMREQAGLAPASGFAADIQAMLDELDSMRAAMVPYAAMPQPAPAPPAVRPSLGGPAADGAGSAPAAPAVPYPSRRTCSTCAHCAEEPSGMRCAFKGRPIVKPNNFTNCKSFAVQAEDGSLVPWTVEEYKAAMAG